MIIYIQYKMLGNDGKETMLLVCMFTALVFIIILEYSQFFKLKFTVKQFVMLHKQNPHTSRVHHALDCIRMPHWVIEAVSPRSV